MTVTPFAQLKRACLLVALTLLLTISAEASANDGMLDLAPDEDVRVDLATPDTNLNGEGLGFTVELLAGDDGMGGTEYCPTITQTSYLKFDLTDVAFAIDKAQLSLSITNLQGDSAVMLESVPDSWNEATLTWQAQPDADASSEMLPISAEIEGSQVVWRDTNASGALVAYLQREQAGDGVASLRFTSPMMTGCSVDPSDGDAFAIAFDDREAPTAALTLADAETSLPIATPAAININETSAETPAQSLLPLSLTALMLLATFMIWWRRDAS